MVTASNKIFLSLRLKVEAQALGQQCNARGVATGVDIGIYTPKISPSKLLWGKNDVGTAIQQFYTSPQKNFYTPPPKKKQISGYAPV